MKKKIASLLMAIMVLVCSIPSNSFADENKKQYSLIWIEQV